MISLVPGNFIKKDGDGPLNSLVVNTDSLVANVSGYEDKVGVCTAEPGGPLEVVNNGGDTDFAIIIKASGVSSEFFSFINQNDDLVMGLQQTGSGDAILRFYDHNGVEGVRLDARAGYTQESFIMDNLGVGTRTPARSAVLHINSTTGALLPPRMTTAQMNALTAIDGMVIYNTTANDFAFRVNGAWVVK